VLGTKSQPDRPRRNEGVTPGNQLPFILPQWLMTGLKHLAHDYGVTPFAALLGSFQAFLGLCAGQNDVLTLVSVAGRNQMPLRRMIGLFANILPMRLILSGVLNFGQLVEYAGEMTSAALSYQQLPLNRTLELLPSSASHINAPALQSLMIYNNAPLPTLECPEVTFTPSLDLDNGTAKFDFAIEVWDSPQSLSGHLKYRSDLYEQPTMERLLQHWQTFIACGIANPFKPVQSYVLKRFLLIFSDRIFDSSVDRGMPNLAAAPVGPDTRPHASFRAASIMFFSCSRSSIGSSTWCLGSSPTGGDCGNQFSSIEKISVSQRMTERSMTFCNSRMFPSQG